MNSDLVREIVYEDDEVVAYADYDLVGRINYENPVDLYIIHKKGVESFDSTVTLNKLNN
jgi:hypothetical protein